MGLQHLTALAEAAQGSRRSGPMMAPMKLISAWTLDTPASLRTLAGLQGMRRSMHTHASYTAQPKLAMLQALIRQR
jgi:hypothetical protein